MTGGGWWVEALQVVAVRNNAAHLAGRLPVDSNQCTGHLPWWTEFSFYDLQSINLSINQSINRSINQSINHIDCSVLVGTNVDWFALVHSVSTANGEPFAFCCTVVLLRRCSSSDGIWTFPWLCLDKSLQRLVTHCANYHDGHWKTYQNEECFRISLTLGRLVVAAVLDFCLSRFSIYQV